MVEATAGLRVLGQGGIAGSGCRVWGLGFRALRFGFSLRVFQVPGYSYAAS